MDFVDALTLSPGMARTIGGWALLAVVALDLLASSDQVPFNTPRDWLLWLTQWRSRGLWRASERALVTEQGRAWTRFVPFHYLPVTGALVPFMCAVLVAHFFHPGLTPTIGPGGFVGLGISLGCGVAVSVLTYFRVLGPGERSVLVVVLAGVLCGLLAWPVS